MKNHAMFSASLCLFLTFPFFAFSQDPAPADTVAWKKKLSFSVNFNQSSFSGNWKAGGVNAFGLNSLFAYQANYTDGRNTWDNDIDMAFGFVNNSGQGYRKTVDRIYLDTKYGYKLSDDWGLFGSLNFLSQFAAGYTYNKDNEASMISGFFAPAFVTGALGFEYHPVEHFTVRIAPFAPRLTIVQDPERFITTVGPEPYGVIPPKTTRFEWVGFQLLAEYNKEIYENVNLKWRYMMFANYETLEAKRLDHRLDIDLVAKLGKYINMGLGGILVYDYDQDDGVQLSQVFSIGFIYTFQNFVE